eukprot:477874-Alexandrium_andersonii.AAC.1
MPPRCKYAMLGGSHGAHPRAAYLRSNVTDTMVSRPRYVSNLEPRAIGASEVVNPPSQPQPNTPPARVQNNTPRFEG